MRSTKKGITWGVGLLVFVVVGMLLFGAWQGNLPNANIASALTGSVSEERVIAIAQEYVKSYGNPDLEVAEIMAFDNQYYVQARERSTGRYAFEFLIDLTGNAYPEPGPNMMWNTKYGHMGNGTSWNGMMGPSGTWYEDDATAVISPERAREIAQAYLDANGLDLEVGDEADAFYGYYTIHTERDGQVVGMLSVNSQTGDVWIHTWHGQYLGMLYAADEGHDEPTDHDE